jgi:hypothetical protein
MVNGLDLTTLQAMTGAALLLAADCGALGSQ